MKPGRALAAVLLGGALSVHAAESPRDALAAGFANPPAEARPLVFWQWVNGNVTEQGIHLDLEWMKRVGLAGAILFDIGFRTPPVPQYVAHRVGFGTEEWRRAVRFAAAEARRLGLSLGAQSSGGWSVSGGPHVPPEQAMKKLVWSETELTPQSPATLRLPAPPRNSGPYQDIPVDAPYREPEKSGDVAVIAFRLPDAEQTTFAQATFKEVAHAELLADGRYVEAIEIRDEGGHAWLNTKLATPPRALTLAVRRGALPAFVVEASIDGRIFVPAYASNARVAQPSPATTIALAETNAKFWRVRFDGLTTSLSLTEARFDVGARLDHAQEKAGFGTLANYDGAAAGPASQVAGIDERSVVDLTAKLAPDGTLNWRPREGRWLVQRFGWSLTGRRNVPATPESIGLEVDKLDAKAVRAYAESFYDDYSRAIGDAGRLDLAFTDSWEAGQQNWTPGMLEEFRRRRGYDLRPWLPVLTGRVVGDGARSERLLADFRLTISELLVANHYGVLADVAHRRGMRYVAQAAGTDLPTVIDGLAAKGRVDMPTGEFWFYPEDAQPKPQHIADIREAASAAHTYGKPQVAAESLTTQGEMPWTQGPAQWRRMVDRFFAEGVNRVILHTSAHQPFTDRVPGITLRQYGQHFTRNETWAADAGAWVDYLARTSYLLQQGEPVADLAIYLGEDAGSAPAFEHAIDADSVAGFDFDWLNDEMLMRLQARDGRVVLPSGASYRLLFIGRHKHMSLPALRKIVALMNEGATVAGFQPWGARGLADDDAALRDVAGDLWGQGKVQIASRQVGRGHLFALLKDAIAQQNPLPDVVIEGAHELHWTHRRTADTDIYFVTNQARAPFGGIVRFRVVGRNVEFWDAIDGTRRPARYEPADQGTAVQLDLATRDSIFVVFRGRAAPGGVKPPAASINAVLALDGPWNVDFLDGRGAPKTAQLSGSWTASTHSGIRYYSGRAKYSRTVSLPAGWLSKDQRVELDLGAVGDLAHVNINGRDLGTWWNPPLRKDITRALRAGENRVEITVTNYWANRLIGDEQPGATKYTFAPIKPFAADSPLRPSGLLGPVRMISLSSKESP